VLAAFKPGANSIGMASADLNGDGLTDFVVAESTGAQVLLGAGDNQSLPGSSSARRPTRSRWGM